MKNNCSLFERLFKKSENDIFLCGISFFVLEILTFFNVFLRFSGVKFEEHCFYRSRDILKFRFYHLSCKPDDVITYLICIIQKRQYR